ncbi:MAG: STT3 domain-containing protein [Desulfomicrobium sp.]|nr:STT3 domain-containing protein [Desulfomicrobium sp.]
MNKSSRFAISQNGELLLALILVVFTTISVRLAEFSFWQNDGLSVMGERLMATHDAYAWLAGAKDIGNYTGNPFSSLLAFLHHVTGMELSEVGFWSPVMLVPLLAVPACLLAWSLGRPEGGLAFGILVTSGLGFLVRTRLGFCDTDLISLLFPLSVSCFLAAWLIRMRESAQRPAALSISDALPAAAIGLLGWIGVYSYPGNVSLMFTTCVLGAALIFLFVPAERREGAATGLLLVFAMTFAGLIGTLLAGVWMIWRMRGPALSTNFRLLGWVLVVAVVLVLADTHEKVWWIVQRLFFYAKTSAPDLVNATTAIRLPEIAQSVREAQNLDWGLLGPRMGGNWVVFVLGLFGFGFAAWRRPVLLLFLPYLALGIASVKLGNRFAMYGTVAIGMGLGFGVSELMVVLKQSQGRRWIAQLTVACVALWPSAQFMSEVQPVPVLPKVYAETFMELRDTVEPDALLWQWWDYGYAAQYYAERASMGDGGRQTGPWLYPLARVHCTDSSAHARSMIQYFGHVVQREGRKSSADPVISLLAGNPVAELMQMDAPLARDFLDNLRANPQSWPEAPPQYLILSWENLRLASWISYYGNWDIASGSSSPGKIQQVRGEIRLDSAAGLLVINGNSTPVDSMDVVEAEGAKHFQWPHGTGTHVVINQMSRQVFLMDAKIYRSMMVQMLLRPASDFSDEFSLVVDNYPWARAYKVRQ